NPRTLLYPYTTLFRSKDAEFLEVIRAVPSAGVDKVSAEEGTGCLECLPGAVRPQSALRHGSARSRTGSAGRVDPEAHAPEDIRQSLRELRARLAAGCS